MQSLPINYVTDWRSILTTKYWFSQEKARFIRASLWSTTTGSGEAGRGSVHLNESVHSSQSRSGPDQASCSVSGTSQLSVKQDEDYASPRASTAHRPCTAGIQDVSTWTQMLMRLFSLYQLCKGTCTEFLRILQCVRGHCSSTKRLFELSIFCPLQIKLLRNTKEIFWNKMRSNFVKKLLVRKDLLRIANTFF